MRAAQSTTAPHLTPSPPAHLLPVPSRAEPPARQGCTAGSIYRLKLASKGDDAMVVSLQQCQHITHPHCTTPSQSPPLMQHHDGPTCGTFTSQSRGDQKRCKDSNLQEWQCFTEHKPLTTDLQSWQYCACSVGTAEQAARVCSLKDGRCWPHPLLRPVPVQEVCSKRDHRCLSQEPSFAAWLSRCWSLHLCSPLTVVMATTAPVDKLHSK